jgi:hypothetical protein
MGQHRGRVNYDKMRRKEERRGMGDQQAPHPPPGGDEGGGTDVETPSSVPQPYPSEHRSRGVIPPARGEVDASPELLSAVRWWSRYYDGLDPRLCAPLVLGGKQY